MKRFLVLASGFLPLTGYGAGRLEAGGWGGCGEAVIKLGEMAERAAERQEAKGRHEERRARAEAGDAEAQLEMYMVGGYSASDWEWLCRSASQGFAHAQYFVGTHHQNGDIPFTKDSVRAYLWHSLAAAQEHATAEQRRTELAKRMSPQQIAEAERRAKTWKAGQCAGRSWEAEERTATMRPPAETPPLCHDVGGYEAYMKRTGKVCRLD